MTLSHVNDENRPSMVNVGRKDVTHRTARAEARVVLPEEILALFEDGEIKCKKGPVFQTAILAGVMAAKRTHEWIPLCHPIGLENCQVDIVVGDAKEVIITCRCETHHKTGVEMEALTGASAAALTVYDMCKGLSREILIRHVRLLEKTGGKNDYRAADDAT